MDDLTPNLGVDSGGSGISSILVDVLYGGLTALWRKFPTPQPATPASVADALWACTLFGLGGSNRLRVSRRGADESGALCSQRVRELDGMNARDLFSRESGCALTVFNDPDAAGLAEMEFGAGRGESGVVMVLTFGTGIGAELAGIGATRAALFGQPGHALLSGCFHHWRGHQPRPRAFLFAAARPCLARSGTLLQRCRHHWRGAGRKRAQGGKMEYVSFWAAEG